MPHNSMVEWCLKKAEKEINSGKKHRGLIRTKPELELIEAHMRKAKHNLKAITDFKKIGYSDWSASAAFYSIYHCFLAIITRFGYESRNQECTFALINHLIETNQIQLSKEIIQEIHQLDNESEQETVTDIRELEQYGIKLSLEEEKHAKLLAIAQIVLDRTKEIIQ